MTRSTERGVGRSVIVLVAMPEEAEPYLRRAHRRAEPERAGQAVLHELEIDGLRVLLVHTGIGFVNAAAAATTAIVRERERVRGQERDAVQMRYRVRHPQRAQTEAGVAAAPLIVFSSGTAGGLGAEVALGDVVVGSSYINIDADARVFGYRLGQVPGMPAVYRGDEAMLVAVEQVASLVGRLSSSGESSGEWSVHPGLIASSYSFVTTERAVIARADFPEVAAVDMESSAIAQVCYSEGVPFVAVRGISDLASATAADDHLANTDSTAERAATVVLALAGLVMSPATL